MKVEVFNGFTRLRVGLVLTLFLQVTNGSAGQLDLELLHGL